MILSDIPVHREQVDKLTCFFPASNPEALAERDEKVNAEQRTPPQCGCRSTDQQFRGIRPAFLAVFEDVLRAPVSAVAQGALPRLLRYEDIARERLDLRQRLSVELQRHEAEATALAISPRLPQYHCWNGSSHIDHRS